jgi:hypothetical protein
MMLRWQGMEAPEYGAPPAEADPSGFPADDEHPLYKTDEFRMYGMKVGAGRAQ